MVPPCVGSGWANTTAARGAPEGASISASSGPAGPAISRITSDNASSLLCSCRRLDEGNDDGGKVARSGDQTQVAGSPDGGALRVRPEAQVLVRQAGGNDPVEGVFTSYDQGWRRDTFELAVEVRSEERRVGKEGRGRGWGEG